MAAGQLLTVHPVLTHSPNPGRASPFLDTMETVPAIESWQTIQGCWRVMEAGFLLNSSIQQMFSIHLLHARHCQALGIEKGTGQVRLQPAWGLQPMGKIQVSRYKRW